MFAKVELIRFKKWRKVTDMSTGWKRVSEAILAEYESRGWSQADLMRESGISDATIRKLERGHTQSYRSNVKRAIEAALEWPSGHIDALLRGPVSLPYDPAAPIDGPRTILAEGMMAELHRLGQLSEDHAALFDQLLSELEQLRIRLDRLHPEQGEAVP